MSSEKPLMVDEALHGLPHPAADYTMFSAAST